MLYAILLRILIRVYEKLQLVQRFTILPIFTVHKKLSCNGHPCAKCGQCRDWYYIGDLASLTWLQNWKSWSKSDWERYRDNKVSERFKKRDGATCGNYFCILDGDDFGLALHFHDLGANAGYHAHHDLCLCTDIIRN